MQGGVLRRRNQRPIKPIEITAKESEQGAELLSPGSIVFHREDFNVNILAIMGCKIPIDVKIVKAKIPIALLKHPRFSSVVVGDLSKGEEQLRWLRTKVDIGKHIIVPEINPNNIESPDKFVENYINNLTKTKLDKSRPLWELHILNVKTSEEVEGFGIFRIHHSLGDGASLIALLLALMRKTSDPNAVPTIPVQKKRYNSKDNYCKSSWLIWRSVLAMWWMSQLFWNTFVDVMMFLATTMFLKDTNTLIKGSPGMEFTPNRIAYKMVSLDDVKLVKNAMNNVTINDVALGITQAGLSRYLNRRYANEGNNNQERATEESGKNYLPKSIRLRSTMVINTRPSENIQALANMMEKDTKVKWGNSIGFLLVPFTIGLHSDPLEHIREMKEAGDRKKHSLEALCTNFIAESAMKYFGNKVAGTLSHRVFAHTTMAFSNVIGPSEELEFFGHPMVFLAPTIYGQPLSLMIHFQSYVNKMMIVISVDEDTIPDPHQLCDDINESLRLFKNAVITQGLVNGTV